MSGVDHEEPREATLAGRRFSVQRNLRHVVVSPDDCIGLRLSDLPEDVAVKPLGIDLPCGPGQQVSCLIYGFRDGSALALVEVAERECEGKPPPLLVAIQQAVCEERDKDKGVDLETLEEIDGYWKLAYVIELRAPLSLQEALKRMVTKADEVSTRSLQIVDGAQRLSLE